MVTCKLKKLENNSKKISVKKAKNLLDQEVWSKLIVYIFNINLAEIFSYGNFNIIFK
jgi:hypothetical protein